MFRPGSAVAELTQPGQPTQRISLQRRSLEDCLIEELRRLDPDEVFGETVRSVGSFEMLYQESVFEQANLELDAFGVPA